MEQRDYKKLGFKCGLEIHQQVAGHKLFCSCPAIVRGDKSDIFVERSQHRALSSEVGTKDAAALFEASKNKRMIYTGDSRDVCLVELDEDPPRELNIDALNAALQVCAMLNCRVVDEIHFMRKAIIDGSICSGFQRTALVGTNGFIETSKGKVGIATVLLEEEASQKVKDNEDSIVWNLDRQGIGLIEIATDATIQDPEHAKECAEKIGMILRSTNKVIRGIGSIRQDVNVSVKDCPRVEIKGFQDLKSIPSVIDTEIDRLEKQLEKNEKMEPHVRKANADGSTSFLRPMPGAARMYPETDVAPMKPSLVGIESVELIDVKAKRLEALGLSKDLSEFIAKSGKTDLFVSYVDKFKNVKPAFIAETMSATLKELKRTHNVDTDKITDSVLERLFEALNKDEISKDSVIEILLAFCKGSTIDSVIIKHRLMSDKDLELEIEHIVKESKEVPFNALIGTAMGRLRGKADGKKIVEMLKKFYG